MTASDRHYVESMYGDVVAEIVAECDDYWRDKGDPSWSLFDLTVSATVEEHLAIREAVVRERIAAEIEAEFVGQDHHEPTFNSGRDAGLRLAARIARGTA